MSSFETAFESVCHLVQDFAANEGYYLDMGYSEAAVRQDFIDKFFIALGWDVLHDEQKNPYEQEVKVERNVSVTGRTKRADYAFSLRPHYERVQFFVEAKKPARDLRNSDDYFQTIRYGYGSQTPLAVLTDFKEFHVLDARFIPDIDTALERGTSHPSL